MTAALQRAFTEAAGGARVGALREVLTAQYARLAQLLEDAIARLVQDTEVLLLSFPVCSSEGHLGRMCGAR